MHLQGGTSMTILGDNFRNRPGAKCIFGNVTTTLTFIDSKRAVCISPPSLIKRRNLVNLTVMLSFDDIANPDLSALCPGTTPAPQSPLFSLFILWRQQASHNPPQPIVAYRIKAVWTDFTTTLTQLLQKCARIPVLSPAAQE